MPANLLFLLGRFSKAGVTKSQQFLQGALTIQQEASKVNYLAVSPCMRLPIDVIVEMYISILARI